MYFRYKTTPVVVAVLTVIPGRPGSPGSPRSPGRPSTYSPGSPYITSELALSQQNHIPSYQRHSTIIPKSICFYCTLSLISTTFDVYVLLGLSKNKLDSKVFSPGGHCTNYLKLSLAVCSEQRRIPPLTFRR